MRIFIAILFTSEVIEQVANYREILTKQNIKGNYQRDDLLHVTLHYIGETSPEDLVSIITKIKEINMDSFEISTSQFNYFGKENAKKLIYLAIEENQQLLKCHRLVIDKLNDLGYQIDKRVYTPHTTLIRQASNIAEDIKKITLKSIKVSVKEIHIMESRRVDNLLVYQSLDSVQLK